jgi:hypothetical protein
MDMWNRMQESMLSMLVPARKPGASPEPDGSTGPDDKSAA